MKAFILILILFFPIYIKADPLPPIEITSLKVPPGFKIAIFARIPFVRQLDVASDGMVYAGSSHHEGNNIVYAIKPSVDYTHAEKIYELAIGLDSPIGVAYHNHDLYIGEHYRISKIPNITGHWQHPAKVEVVLDNMPSPLVDNIHARKYLKFSPDHRLYFQVGDPVDSSQSDNPFLHSIMSIKPNGSDLQIYARGIRNSVGFDWEPQTHILWFTDNGQDALGDLLPPDEINRAPHKGMDFGFPCYTGQNIRMTKYQHCPSASKVTPAIAELEAHSAPLGLMFYTGKQFPPEYKNNIFVAQHGSSVRRDKVGYKIVRLIIKDNKVSKIEPLVSGWLHSSTFWGRPVDVAELPDGSILISDDYSGTIYRLSYLVNKR